MRWRRVLVGVLVTSLVLAAAAAYVLSRAPFGGTLHGARLERARANPQFRGGEFVNPRPPAERRSGDTWALLGDQLFGTEQRVPLTPIPVLAVAPEALAATPRDGALRAFWIGHSSVYVEIDGLRLLIDPVFSDYASPFEFGPRRFQPPPIALNALPPIDAVLITHDHYDHLDMASVQQLARRGSLFVVPLGIGAHLETWGVPAAQIKELEWWQEHVLRGVRLVSTPARHYSGRRLTGRGPTLWTSWSVLGARHRFYVSGDTGYDEHFRQIGERFGPFDLAFVKIGAYGPGAFWLDIHMSAEDAVRASAEVRARRLFPVHWATFNLAMHDWDEPIERTLAEAKARQVELLTPRIGEWVDADQPLPFNPWWRSLR